MSRGISILGAGGLAAGLMIAPAAAFAQTGAQTGAQETPTVACPTDETSRCLQVPGVAVPPEGAEQPLILSALGPWSASVSGGVAPRDGGPTGAYGSVEVRRQVGHGYVQIGAMHFDAPLMANAISVASSFNIGTVAGGGHIGNWILDGYVSYGWQDFGAVQVEDASGTALIRRATNGRGGSPYYGAGGSIGRIAPVGERLFITPTVALTYAWGRWLHPLGQGGQDFTTGETTLTGTARLRVDRMMGRARRSYLGLSVAGLWSSNASSFAGVGAGGGGVGAVGPGVPDPGANTVRLHDPWVEIAGHGSLAVSRSLRVEASVARTVGLVTGDTTTVNLGLRRQF